MYLGSNSVHDLEKFINGYGFALTVYDIQENFIVVDSMSFHDWIALRTHLYESTSGWANMLDSYYGSEEKALEMFFIHYDEFKHTMGVRSNIPTFASFGAHGGQEPMGVRSNIPTFATFTVK